MKLDSQRGMTILELIVTLGIVSIVSAIAISNLKEMNKPLENAAYSAELFLQLARSRAISGTQMVKVKPISNTKLEAYSGSACNDAMVAIAGLTQTLPSGTSLADTTWFICFSPRGRADAAISFNINDIGHKTKILSVARGGGVKIHD